MTWHQDFFEIDLHKVLTSTVNNWQTKDSQQYIKEWMMYVKEIQYLCRKRGFTPVDFQRLKDSVDHQEVAIYETYCHLYKLSGSNIKVVWEGNHYSVENGNHRILTAKQMGLQHLPARVNAPSFAAIEMLKAHAEEIARFEKPLTPAQKLEWFKQVRVTGISTLMTSNRSPTL